MSTLHKIRYHGFHTFAINLCKTIFTIFYIRHCCIIAVGTAITGREVPGMADTKKMTLAIRGELVPWISYAAGLRDMTVTAYINDALARDRDNAKESVKAGYEAFLRAREGE